MSLSAIFDPLVRAWFEENGGGGGKAVDDGYYITWDKNPAGRPFIDLSFMMNDSMTSIGLYKVSDAIISAEGFAGFAGTMRLGADGVVNSDLTTIAAASGWSAVFLEDYPLVVSGKAGKYNYNGIPIVIPADGTYFLYATTVDGNENYMESIYNSIGGSTGGSGGGEDDAWIGDGNTHIWINLPEGRTSPMLGVCPNGTVTVDWGDGTEPDVLTGTSETTVKWTPTHEYAKAGDYRITLTVDGTMGAAGTDAANAYSGILRYSSAADALNPVYQAAVKRIELGNGVIDLRICAFKRLIRLEKVKISDGVKNLRGDSFSDCYSLKAIEVPESVTAIDYGVFARCYSLTNVKWPSTPPNVGANTFHTCACVAEYDFTSYKTVPTLANTSVFYGIAPDCEIRVPAALVDSWKAATNWATYADYIVGV